MAEELGLEPNTIDIAKVPNEILLEMFEHLQAAQVEHPRGIYNTGDMRNLCLTSKRLKLLASSLLYDSIRLPRWQRNSQSLSKLSRTLKERPDLGRV
jgi:hypothetical protein